MGRYSSRSRSRGRRGGGGGGGSSESGTVATWNDMKGFGFISPRDGGEDLFVHVSGIQDGNALREGETVNYRSVYDDRKGKYRAEDVTGGYQDHQRDERRSGGGGGKDDGGYGKGGGRGYDDDRRGGYDDRRGGYDDRRGGGYDDRRGKGSSKGW